MDNIILVGVFYDKEMSTEMDMKGFFPERLTLKFCLQVNKNWIDWEFSALE